MKNIRKGDLEFTQIDQRSLEEMNTFASLDEELWNRIKLLKNPGRCEDLLNYRYKIRGALKRNLLSKKIYSYIRQAEEYYMAGKNSSLSTAPLLYYYGMLNLSKIIITIWQPDVFNKESNLFHGLSDPQRVKTISRNPFRNQFLLTKNGVFTLLYKYFTGKNLPLDTKIEIIDILSRIIYTSIEFEETFGRIDSLVHVDLNRVMNTKTNDTWLTAYIQREELREKHMNISGFSSLAKNFLKYFEQVNHPDSDLLVFQTKQNYIYKCRKKRGEDAIYYLVDLIRKINLYSLPNRGCFYLPLEINQFYLPQGVNLLAAMFYFGMLVRYNPYYWDDIINNTKNPYEWYLNFFTYYVPIHFLDIIVSEIFKTKFMFNETIGLIKRKGYYSSPPQED